MNFQYYTPKTAAYKAAVVSCCVNIIVALNKSPSTVISNLPFCASTKLFNEADFGKWKFCKEEDIRAIVGENISDMKIAVMADVGRTDYKQDFLPKSESVIDMVRVACYLRQIPTAIDMVEHFHSLGYETACNIMAVSQANSDQLMQALDMLAHTNVDVIYLVDSYGSLYPENASELAKKYVAAVEGTGKQIGFHAHNNQNLAFANTIETMSYGLSFMDATMQGIGRGAGNCSIELLVGFLKNPKYNIYHLLKFIEKHDSRITKKMTVLLKLVCTIH